MTLGSALASRAIGDAARRSLASEWTGPEPAAARNMALSMRVERPLDRRLIIRKP